MKSFFAIALVAISSFVVAQAALNDAYGFEGDWTDVVYDTEDAIAEAVLNMTMCRCTGDKNGYECSDGTSAYCSVDQDCYATDLFVKGDWAMGCANMCECTGTGNQYKCSDGTVAYCASTQSCEAEGMFMYGDWAGNCVDN